MLKITYFREVGKLVTCKLQPIIADYLIRSVIAGKVTLLLQNGDYSYGVWQSIQLPEVALIVYGNNNIINNKNRSRDKFIS